MATWTDTRLGSGAECTLSTGLRLVISYEGIESLGPAEPRFNVYVFGLKLKGRSRTADEAKRRAERAAAIWLEQALAALE